MHQCQVIVALLQVVYMLMITGCLLLPLFTPYSSYQHLFLKKPGLQQSALCSVFGYLLGFHCVQSTVFKRVSADRLIAI